MKKVNAYQFKSNYHDGWFTMITSKPLSRDMLCIFSVSVFEKYIDIEITASRFAVCV